MRIFLSHRSNHKPLVREFKDQLPAFLRPWLDEETLVWGDAFENELKSSIQSDVDFLIIFLDAAALSSRWVRQELDWALEREPELARTFVLPIVLDDTPPEQFPPALATRLQLRLQDYTSNSVTELARRASEQLFHLVARTLTALEKAKRPGAFRPTNIDFLQGEWHECHFTYRGGRAQLVREQWQIRGYRIQSTTDSGLTYSGVIGEDDWTLVANFEGTGHAETVICRLYKPIPSTDFIIRGMWFAVDHDNNIACGPEVVSRRKLDDASARRVVQSNVERHKLLPLIKLLR
jgi:hypothetical protein